MARVSSPILLDRVDDLRRLDAAWHEAAGGRPRLVLLAGEAGIGKSRLTRELAARTETNGGLAMLGSCLRLGDAPLPFVPIAEIVRRLARDPDADVRAAHAAVVADIAPLVPSAAGAGPTRDLTEAAARARLFEGVLGLLTGLATGRPVLVGIEDVQWSDPATRDLLTFLARNLRDERLLLVLTLRTDGLPRADPVVGWIAELLRVLPAERIDLDRLQPEDIGRQVEAITGDAPTVAELEQIWQRSEGNPFFVEELVAAGLTGPPRTLAEILLARVAVLSATSRRVVRAVAVAGTPVADDVLGPALGVDRDDLVAALREPIDAGLLRIDENGLVRPRHALLSEVVEASLLAGERRELHEALAAAFEGRPRASGQDAAAAAAARARHWLAAGRVEEAYRASLDAAAAASAVFAHAEASSHLDRALEVGRSLSPAPAASERVAILVAGAAAADLAGETATAIDRTLEAIGLVDERADPGTAGMLHGTLGYLRWVAGHAEEALDEHRRAVRLVPPEPATPERARVLAALGGALMGAGRYAESRTVCEEAVRVAQRAGAVNEESRARNMLGSDLVALGDVDAGLAELRTARRLAGEGGPLDLLIVAHHNLALNLLLADRREEAVAEALAGRDVARRVGLERRYAPHLVGVAADALFRSGRWDEAAALADAQLASVPASRATVYLAGVRARLHAGRGEVDDADAQMVDAERQGGDDVDPDLRAYLALARAETALAHGRWSQALDAARAGLEGLDASEDRASRLPLLAVLVRSLAEIAEDARAARRPDDAGVAAAEAGGLAREATRIAAEVRTPTAAALAARTTAEAARAAGSADVPAWDAAVAEADRADLAAQAAEARLGLADALLRSKGDRLLAGDALRQAATAAAGRRARPLSDAIETLARRARLDLGTAGMPATAEGHATSSGPPTSPATARHPLPSPTSPLSERELEVLRLVAQGRSNGQIAERLFITRKTASAHVTHILDKLGVSNRLEAAMTASRLGLLTPADDDDTP